MAVLVDTHSLATKTDTDALKNEFELLRRDMQIWKRDVSIQVWVFGTATIGVMAAFHFLG